MCGRYYIDDETVREIGRVVCGDGGRLAGATRGDVNPSQTAMVITGREKEPRLEEMRWGFPQNQGSGLIINARAESVLERRMFRESVLHRRCVIPARHFYEWSPKRDKVTFLRENSPVLYLAGFYDRFRDGDRFVIITTQANASVRPVHDRMPLILEERELRDWLYDGQFFQTALRKEPPLLSRQQEYEQQSLFSEEFFGLDM